MDYKKIAISNRSIFMEDNRFTDFAACKSDYIEQLQKVTHVTDYLILREKDMNAAEYAELAKVVLDKCGQNKATIILHSFLPVAEELNYKRIHLPLPVFLENREALQEYDLVGVSTHSLEEACLAEKLGASYVTFSHIFVTDCKKGLEPRGLEALKEVCAGVKIPVYALGGINDDNEMLTIKAGAEGACRMSEYMKMK